MKSRLWVAGFLFLALAGVARAEEADAVKATVGKVQGTYARLARGVFVQTSAMPAHARQGAEIWVDVRFAGTVADARDGVIARAPGGERIETGDLVDVRLFPIDGRARAPLAQRAAALTETSQVTGVRSKYYTTEAMDFGAPPAPALRERPVLSAR